MDVGRIRKLVEDVKLLPQPKRFEQTIFSIGGRGYYENPTTDILAFFCDTDAAHNLGDLVLSALFDAIGQNATAEYSRPNDLLLSRSPDREVRTATAKRIDLLLEANEWVIILENKIYHHQNNPFFEYEEFYRKHVNTRFVKKKPFFIVLSPAGTAPEGWIGVAYQDLVKSLKEVLSDYFFQQPLNKWMVLLRDFLIHLESLVSKSVIPEETLRYVIENLNGIRQIEEAKQLAIEELREKITKYLQGYFEEPISSSIETWHGYPALRFYFSDCKNESNVVLFLDGRKDKKFCLNFYIYKISKSKIEANAQCKDADNFFEHQYISVWSESNNTIQCYKQNLNTDENRHEMNLDKMQEALKVKLEQLRAFERDVRSKW